MGNLTMNNKKIVLYLGVFFVIIFFITPIIWQILTSIKTNEAISAIPNVYIPKTITFEHYIELFRRRPFGLYIFNSALVSIVSTFICLVIGSPAAYVLARLNIPGKNLILGLVLIVSLFPYVLLFLGLLEVIKLFGLGNNYLALIVPYTGINLPLTILVMRSFFEQLPKDLEDAARIDGYKMIPMLLQILLPMTLPALVTTGILTFIFAWNEYIFALTFITRETMKTIPVATAQIGGATIFEIPYGPIAAATVLGTFPLVLLVLFFQRRIVEGLTAGAVKG
ncbi:probable permease protein of sugar ABC transporter, membrane component [Crocosphaera subtropica ATCC 51142]|uniref:Probable permease protein of sugar ABC transporter, membrane component n=2 Tax=Crocosphaera TaxID=263510 RepID=B1WSW4_CROS5|nr:probable permease protein of sugar ABC transporter, membrane component [Crocosphaera subtropica ATCC 51142]